MSGTVKGVESNSLPPLCMSEYFLFRFNLEYHVLGQLSMTILSEEASPETPSGTCLSMEIKPVKSL